MSGLVVSSAMHTPPRDVPFRISHTIAAKNPTDPITALRPGGLVFLSSAYYINIAGPNAQGYPDFVVVTDAWLTANMATELDDTDGIFAVCLETQKPTTVGGTTVAANTVCSFALGCTMTRSAFNYGNALSMPTHLLQGAANDVTRMIQLFNRLARQGIYIDHDKSTFA